MTDESGENKIPSPRPLICSIDQNKHFSYINNISVNTITSFQCTFVKLPYRTPKNEILIVPAVKIPICINDNENTLHDFIISRKLKVDILLGKNFVSKCMVK